METEKAYRILVCGGRDWSNLHMTESCLDGFREQYHEKGKPIVIVQGGATGADFIAKKWAEKHDIPCEEHKADWKRHGRGAGPVRNAQMLTTGIDVVVAFPGGRGTQDTIKKAETLNIRVWKPARAELYELLNTIDE